MRFQVIINEWPSLAAGFGTTIWICALSGVLSLLLALPLAALLTARRAVIVWPVRAVVDGLRAIPFLMLVFLSYYCLPVFGLRFSSWTCGLVSLIVYNTAYFGEILRGAWAHLPREQEEAGRAFGFYGFALTRRIILPQILISAGPVLGNQMITLIKNSAFLMVITIPELTFTANQVQAIYFAPLETMIVAVLLYWLLCSAVEWIVRVMDHVSMVRGHE
jgi:polar amino acid transport system permease protein